MNMLVIVWSRWTIAIWNIYSIYEYNDSYTDEIVKIKINTRVFVNPINNCS